MVRKSLTTPGRETMSTNGEQESAVQHNGSPQKAAPRAEEARNAPAQAANSMGDRKASFGRFGETITKPVTGATITGAVVLGAASLFGVVEALVGAGAAYGVYLVVNRRREPKR
jgi:hypothetical protein